MSPELTPQEIAQRRRQKILARTKKLQLQQNTQQSQPAFTQNSQQNQGQNVPFLPPTPKNQASYGQVPSTPKSQQNKQQKVDAFTRFRQLQAKAQRQKNLLIFAKVLGIIVAIVQLYLMSVLKRYQIKHTNREITQQYFDRVKQKFIDQLDLVFWACFGTLVFSWIWIKFVRSARQHNEKIEIVPGSTMFSLLQQLNKFLEYKVLVKAVLGYTFSCVVLHLIMNHVVMWLGYEDVFYKPDLAEFLKPVIETVQNQQIL